MAKYDNLERGLRVLLKDLQEHGSCERFPDASFDDFLSARKAIGLAWMVTGAADEDLHDPSRGMLGDPKFNQFVNDTTGEQR